MLIGMSSRNLYIELAIEDLRTITGYAAQCAMHALGYFGSGVADARPRQAIEAALAFASGGPRTAALRAAAWAAYSAGQAVEDPVATAAAHSATQAAAAAFLHPKTSAHQVKHILGAAAYAARAIELAHPEKQGAAVSFLDQAIDRAPSAVRMVLLRFPHAPAGGGRVGELLRRLDAALRH